MKIVSCESKKKKVLVIQSVIPHYRVPIFNELAKSVELTVVYDKGKPPADVAFATEKIEVIRVKHVPKIHKKNVLWMARKYDVVIAMLDNSYLTTRLLARCRGKTKFILWGIGVSASYSVRYDSLPQYVSIYKKMIHNADAALFYSQYPVSKYESLGEKREKLFVANNTVRVLAIEEKRREHILFVGSLYKAKKIFELLTCYKKAKDMCPDVPDLVIIGDGDEAGAVRSWVKENGLDAKITLTGAIYDEKILSEYFSRAIICISPDQAGLTVLQSFGYGVPFATHKDAFTGGERLNITSGENGVLLESFEEMTTLICDCAREIDHFVEMGNNAKRFYDNNRTVQHMVSGFLDAIAFVTKE